MKHEIVKGIFVGEVFDCDKTMPTIHIGECCSSKNEDKTRNLYFSLRDNGEESESRRIMDILLKSYDFINKWRNDGGVFIHCTAGLSRSPTLIFLYLINIGEVKNYAEFKKLYPEWYPNLGFQILFRKLGID